jgi:hypothetical protein
MVANFYVDGIEDLMNSFENIALMPDKVIDDVLNAQADVVVEKKKHTAKTMLKGPYSRGMIANSIKKGKVKRGRSSASITIDFVGMANDKYHRVGTTKRKRRGKRTREDDMRIASIAFINEYGKTNQPARPFIRTAIELSEKEALKASEKILDDFYKKNNL